MPGSDDDGGPDSGDPAFSIDAALEPLVIPQGGHLEIAIAVTRMEGFDEPITITVVGLPDGVTGSEITLGPTETVGTLTLSAPETIGVPKPNLARVRGHASSGSKSAPIQLMVRGAAGSVDQSFIGAEGVNGIVEALADIYDVEEQPDGKLVFTGSADGILTVCRIEASGASDLSFGSSAGCSYFLDGSVGTGQDVEVDDDGRIVLSGGIFDSDVFVVRLTPDGDLDASFGVGGIVRIANPGNGARTGLLLVGGKIVVSGGMGTVRLNGDGSIDRWLGEYSGQTLLLLRDGRIAARNGPSVRVFGGGGVLLPFSTGDGLAQTCNGDLLAPGGSGMAVARISAGGSVLSVSGSLDGVNEQGNHFYAGAQDIAVLGNGTMVISGGVYVEESQTAIARRLPDGTPDPGFGFGGITGAGYGDSGTDVEVLRDGRYVVAGTRNQADGLLVRIWD